MAIKTKHKQTEFKVGDRVQVKHSFREQDKTLNQTFEGLVIAIKGRERNKTFTVRKISNDGTGVEKIWPLYSPSIIEVKVIRSGNVRRSKLYYLRDKKGKEALKVK